MLIPQTLWRYVSFRRRGILGWKADLKNLDKDIYFGIVKLDFVNFRDAFSHLLDNFIPRQGIVVSCPKLYFVLCIGKSVNHNTPIELNKIDRPWKTCLCILQGMVSAAWSTKTGSLGDSLDRQPTRVSTAGYICICHEKHSSFRLERNIPGLWHTSFHHIFHKLNDKSYGVDRSLTGNKDDLTDRQASDLVRWGKTLTAWRVSVPVR